MTKIQTTDTDLQRILATPDAWTRDIEQVMLTALNANKRVIGITSPTRKAGVSLAARLLATSFSRAMRKTLLIDLSKPMTSISESSWSLGKNDASEFTRTDINGFDVLDEAPTRLTRARFNHAEELGHAFNDELKDYEVIVVDLPSCVEGGNDQINGVAAAVACDAVLLVCATGKTKRSQIRQAVDLLKVAGANVMATVVNEHYNLSFDGLPMWISNIIAKFSGVEIDHAAAARRNASS